MQHDDDDQRFVADVLGSRPPDEVPRDFLARVNARIDALRPLDNNEGWFALADFRAWTLRLAPIAGALALVGLLWSPSSSASENSSATTQAPSSQAQTQGFTPASAADWQRDVTANALLEAAFPREGGRGAR